MADFGEGPPVMKDRRVGLVVFGVLELLLAGLCLLEVGFIGLVVFLRGSLPQAHQSQLHARTLLPGLVFYVALAALFILLGIGSIRCRRWARTLTHLLSTGWLAIGVPTTVFSALALPKLMAAMPSQPGLGDEARQAFALIATVAATAILIVLFIGVPGALFLFYRSPHVKATCEARDPVAPWTDACPAPVLGLALVLGLTGVFGLLSTFSYQAFPLFGFLLEGNLARSLLLLLSANSIVLGWFIYRMRAWAFWASVVFNALWALSGFVSFQRLGLEDLFRVSGQPADFQALALWRAMPTGPLVFVALATTALWVWLYWAAGRAILRQTERDRLPQ